MIKKTLCAIFCCTFGLAVSAQYGKVKIEATDHLIKEESGLSGKPIAPEDSWFRNPPSDDQMWRPLLTNISKNESEDDELLQRIKAEKNKQKAQIIGNEAGHRTSATSKDPVVNTNFAGIDNGGSLTPLDNTIAISNNDTIVAFVNSAIGYFTTAGTQVYSKTLFGLIGPSVTNNLCDPKVLFDNVAKRFILYAQVCDQLPANSKVILGFSKSSNPMDGWNFYKFSGNPLNNNCWWDYPKMGISNDEVFVSGNLFSPTGSFNQSVILQVQKSPCYAGGTPASRIWSAISSGGGPAPFTFLPLSYGQTGSYGPGIYLVSTWGAVTGFTNYKLYDITNNIASGTAVINVYNVSSGVPAYSAAGDASQLGTTTQKLNTGDNRAQDGFYLNGMIHFVHNKDVGSGFCGLSYNRLTVSSLTNVNATYSNVSGAIDRCYPGIVSASNDSNDKSVIVAYNESGSSIYPRTCVVGCDVAMNWSSSAGVRVKDGVSYVQYPGGTGTVDRWGDYTGICKKYGDTAGTAWMAGMYGNANHTWSQWIAKLKPYPAVGIPAVELPQSAARVYPNPILDNYHVSFTLTERQNIVINITDMQGRIVVELYRDIAEKGDNLFSFNKANLSPGIYSLNITGAVNNIKNEQIIIAGK